MPDLNEAEVKTVHSHHDFFERVSVYRDTSVCQSVYGFGRGRSKAQGSQPSSDLKIRTRLTYGKTRCA